MNHCATPPLDASLAGCLVGCKVILFVAQGKKMLRTTFRPIRSANETLQSSKTIGLCFSLFEQPGSLADSPLLRAFLFELGFCVSGSQLF